MFAISSPFEKLSVQTFRFGLTVTVSVRSYLSIMSIPSNNQSQEFFEFDFQPSSDPVLIASSICPGIRGLKGTPEEVLIPLTRDQARRNSLSRSTGKGCQPPHTDGAHMGSPPRYVLLWTTTSTQTHAPTFIWNFDPSLLDRDFRKLLERTIWCVKLRSDSFHYRRCIGRDESIRWDSGCFIRSTNGLLDPSDVDRELSNLPKKQVLWSPRHAVLINNKIALHGRGDATNKANDSRTLSRVCFYDD